MDPIYLDNNATTVIDPLVIAAMLEELQAPASNPSSVHQFGRMAKKRLHRAREQLAAYLDLSPSELIFTASGTEALHLFLHGIAPKGPIITSQIEHAALYKTLKQLDAPIEYLHVGPSGHVDIEEVKEKMSEKVGLIALSGVNSETGVMNPVEEIAELAAHYRVPFLVDGVAWLGKAPLQIPKGVSGMVFSAHKIHGPKGVGLLALRRDVPFTPQILGGGQEAMRRAGTENLPGIIGFAKAVELLSEKAMAHMRQLRDLLEKGLNRTRVNGTGPRVANTSSITFEGIDGETLLIQLDQAGIMASMGSACSSGALEPSPILLNMGLSSKEALSTLRFSLSRFTTQKEIEDTLSFIKTLCVQKFF